MTDAILNLLTCIVVSMLGAYFLTEWAISFWPATAGCFYALIVTKAFQS